LDVSILIKSLSGHSRFARPDLPAGQVDKAAFTLCAVMHLHAALELEDEPAGHLAELASALEGAYTRVLDGLGDNIAVQFAGGRLQVEKLGRRRPSRP
jgi:hypothetical protein